jgi:uridylate kinase
MAPGEQSHHSKSETKSPIYKRILLKISGEALQGKSNFGIDPKVLNQVAKDIAELAQMGVQVGVVIGGGNLFRGAALAEIGLGRITGDHMGMLATIMNALALRDALERIQIPTRIMSAIAMTGVVDYYDRRHAIHHLEEHRVVLFTAGTGNPLVTTDSAASLRSIEIDADILLKATNVDGIFSSDPAKDKTATLYKHLTYEEALKKELAVMDLTAFCQCRDHGMPIRVFNINNHGILKRIMLGSEEGTQVNSDTVQEQ